MSQNVSCPKCGHAFEVDAEFEKYEKIVVEIVGGEKAPSGTTGYDVIGPDGKTYQVKHTGRPHRSMGGINENWRWCFYDDKLRSDFFVLFAGPPDNYLIFLIDYITVKLHLTRRDRNKSGLAASTSNNGWIRNYQTTPKTFMQKRDELLRVQQLRLEIESQYAL